MELRLLKREVFYRGKVFDLVVDKVAYPSGVEGVREVARHPGGAVVVPMFDDGSVLLVSQLRYPLGKHIIELPAGKLGPGEDPRHAAARELEEETGYRAAHLEKLTSLYTTPGFCTEELHLYLATNLQAVSGGHRREEGEQSMTTSVLPLSETILLIDRGEISDAKTIVGLLLVARRRGVL